jgi:hypothetical protein
MLTKAQNQRFWREWTAIFKARAWDAPTAERERKALLARAGFTSLTLVDPRRGFDRVLAQLGYLRDNVEKTIETITDEPGERRRLHHLITQEARWFSIQLAHNPPPDSYAIALARDKFGITAGLSTIQDLTLDQLRQLLITLTARRRKKEQTIPTPCSPLPAPQPVHSEDPF